MFQYFAEAKLYYRKHFVKFCFSCNLFTYINCRTLKNILLRNFVIKYVMKLLTWEFNRAGNLLIGFLSELLVFFEKMSERATWANRSWSLVFGEWPELFAHIAHFWCATWAIRSHRSPKMRECGNRYFLKIKNLYKTY